MATCGSDLPVLLEKEFDEWLRESRSEDIFLIESSGNETEGVTLQLLLASEHEVQLWVPGGYPSALCCLTIKSSPSLQKWCNSMNEYIEQAKTPPLLIDVLNKAISMYKTESECSKNENDSSEEEAIEEGEDEETNQDNYSSEEETYPADWELKIAPKKTHWRQKESELKTELRRKWKESKISYCKKHPCKQVFSSPATSGILINDLISIMKHEEQSGIKTETINDNIYNWVVKMSKFPSESLLSKDLEELRTRCGYDYIELHMHFSMELYPFYPPIVKIIRPRLKGLKSERLSSIQILKPFELSYWNPAFDMNTLLNKVKNFISNSLRIDLNHRRNNPSTFPEGAYQSLEQSSMLMGVICEIEPRTTTAYRYNVTKQVVLVPNSKELRREFCNSGISLNNHRGRPSWDVNAYMAAQQEKDHQTEKILYEILKEIKNIKQLEAHFTDKTCASFTNPAIFNNKDIVSQMIHNDTNIHNDNDSSEKEESHITNEDNIRCEEMEEAIVFLLESSFLTFLEKCLEVDNFLTISGQATLYKGIIDLIKEIAHQSSLLFIFGTLPCQPVSIHQKLEKLAEKSNGILERLGKVAANGCIPGMSKNSSPKISSPKHKSFSDENDPNSSGVVQTVKDRSTEERLARDFSLLYKIVTEFLQKQSQLEQASVLRNKSVLEPIYPVEDSLLANFYKQCLKPLQFETWDMEVDGPFGHYYAFVHRQHEKVYEKQGLRVIQELSNLSSSLPLDITSSIFVRTDETKISLLRALITGPEGTPYANGCFQFDIYLPSKYPIKPPKVNFRTTGNRNVRFHPHLWVNGRVCLSLLNKENSIQGEHWHENCTVLQVLMEIQNMLKTTDPLFAENIQHTIIRTNIGNWLTSTYNKSIYHYTLKYAILKQFHFPTPGFEEVTKAHFYLKRHRIIQEVEKWTKIDSSLLELAETLKRELMVLQPPNEDVARVAV